MAPHSGCVFLAGPGIVLVGPEHAKFVFAETDKRLSIRRAYPFFVHMFGADGYFLADEQEYKRQRDIVLPRFQARQLESHVEIMDQLTDSFMDRLGDTGEIDLINVLGPHVMNVASDCFLGSDISARIDGSFFHVFRQFSEGLDPLVPGWAPVPKMIRCHRARDLLREVIGEIILERRRQPLDPPDFLQVLSEARYPDGRQVPDHRLVNLILMFIWVGSTAGTRSCGARDRAPASGDVVHRSQGGRNHRVRRLPDPRGGRGDGAARAQPPSAGRLPRPGSVPS